MEICAVGLGRRFGSLSALEGLNFTCGPGEIIAVLGDNGAGKTTLLHLLAGLLVPSSGSLRYDGKAYDRLDDALRSRIGFLSDFPPFYFEHRVLDHLAMLTVLHDLEPEPGYIADLLENFGLAEQGMALLSTLSRGQRYKAGVVALALVSPDLWLLDEPMASGMDPRGLYAMREILLAHKARGATIFYTTQIPEVVEGFSDRVLLIHKGRPVALASAAELREQTHTTSLGAALEQLTRP